MKVCVLLKMNGSRDVWTEKYIRVLEHNNVEHTLLNVNDQDLLAKVAQHDVVIYHWAHSKYDTQIAHTLLPIIENEMGKIVLPNQSTCWHYDDKIRQSYLMKLQGYPFIDTWVFWDRGEALQWVEQTQYPVVFKLTRGAGSSNVVLVRTAQQARKLVDKMFLQGAMSSGVNKRGVPLKKLLGREVLKGLRKARKQRSLWIPFHESQYVMFQKFLPNNEYDTRVTVVGDRAFAFLRYNRAHDFRASGSGRIDHDPSKIDMRCVEMAHKISQTCGFQSMAYDFLFDENNEPMFCEISYTYQDTAVHACSGHWTRDLEWVEGNSWTEHIQLVDALGRPDLLCPNFGENPYLIKQQNT